MDRLLDRIIQTEATPEAPVEPAQEAAPEAPAPAAEPEAPAVEYAQIPQDQWDAIQQRLEQAGPVLDYMSNIDPDQLQQQPQQPQFDPYTGQPLQQQPQQMPDPYADPQGFQQWLDQRDEQRWEQRMGPLQPVLEHTMTSVSDQVTNQAVSELASEFGFLAAAADAPAEQQQATKAARDLVVNTADALVMQGEQDPHKALRDAATHVQQLIDFGKSQGQSEFLASRGEGSPTEREPGINGQGVPGMGEPTTYEEARRRALGV